MTTSHTAEGAALGFYYQTLFALLTLVAQNTDNSAVSVEQLDDVALTADGHALLYQLKHSIAATPSPTTLKSRSLWRTIKVWVDILPEISLSETTLHLVSVGGVSADNPLAVLTKLGADRAELVSAMRDEAHRVIDARTAAAKLNKKLPYSDRAEGCEAFLALSGTEQLNLMRRVLFRPNSPAVSEIENRVADHLTILPVQQRSIVSRRLVEWWDRQVVYSLCGKRDRVILRTELLQQISAIVCDIEQGKLLPDFEAVSPPEDYQPDGMLARQIGLVEGRPSDLSRAIREEWRAREQRSKWLNENSGMASIINDYDRILREEWSDKHCQLVEEAAGFDAKKKCQSGLQLLRWTHEEAPARIRPISDGWGATYYVRGSYQVLAINLTVGWHPEYETLLEGGE